MIATTMARVKGGRAPTSQQGILPRLQYTGHISLQEAVVVRHVTIMTHV